MSGWSLWGQRPEPVPEARDLGSDVQSEEDKVRRPGSQQCEEAAPAEDKNRQLKQVVAEQALDIQK